jgi:hypothetical protein
MSLKAGNKTRVSAMKWRALFEVRFLCLDRAIEADFLSDYNYRK